MKSSDSIQSISKSLVKAQKEMSAAKKGAANPFFKSKYADYNAVLEACKDQLNENGITILQPHSILQLGENDIAVVETILLHESGEFILSETKIEVAKKNDPQALGSAITYARRYGLQSLVALPASDDDGESAMDRKSSSSYKKPAAKKAETKPEAKPEVKKETASKPNFRRNKKAATANAGAL